MKADLNFLIAEFLLIPLLGFLVSLLLPARDERKLAAVALLTTGIQFVSFVVFAAIWMWQGFPVLNVPELVLYRSGTYEFLIDLYFDHIAALYIFTGSLLTFLITIYSRYYLHRESGYKRFFNTMLLFFLAYHITVLAGNFETLFIGWEMLGISSFLLIAFYRERYLPVRNAVKVFSVYRIGDVGILLAMWASHHLWHENITFMKLNQFLLVHDHLAGHSLVGIFISVMLLVAASAKSAQLPFSSWLPRAMEGPTPSSAIFYGSLSVHFGVFLLLRTQPFWEQQLVVRILIGLTGICSSILGSQIARVQSTVKSQVAYASISQIGLIFLEVALGFNTLALIHFAGNAFLRTYQLLVSPSVVSYKIREQIYQFRDSASIQGAQYSRLRILLYVYALKEWNLDAFVNKLLFAPLKKLGHRLDFLSLKLLIWIGIPGYLLGMLALYYQPQLPSVLFHFLPASLAGLGLMLVLKAFSERHSPVLSWWLVFFNHCWIALAVSFNAQFSYSETFLYLFGTGISALAGHFLLMRLQQAEPDAFDLNRYYGHQYEHSSLALWTLICALGLMGFPITTAFIGEDLLFSHIREQQFVMAFFYSLSYILGGIALIRLYARLYMGPHVRTSHSLPYKSS